MTKATQARQLRLLISGVLAKYGIDNLQLEIELTDAARRFFDDRQSSNNPVAVRLRLEKALETGIAAAGERTEMQMRVEKALGIDVSSRRFDELIEFLLRKEKSGQTIELYAAWAKENVYDSPKKHQIAQDPQLVCIAWPAAFAEYKTSIDYTGGRGIGI